jgi:hypothetical protein
VAKTPKAVRRNGGNCVCPGQLRRITEAEYDEGTCKYGYCFAARCRRCTGSLFEAGPVACPCDGHPRWARHPGMEAPGYWDEGRDEFVRVHVAVKPSILRRRATRRPR